MPLTLTDVGSLIQNKIDILMIGIFLPGSAVGIYNLSTVLAEILNLPNSGFNTIFPPIAARMYSNNELADLEALFTQVTRWAFTLSLLPAVGLLVFSNEILLIFGEGFGAGRWVLSLFVIGHFVGAATGPTGYMLMMTDHQYFLMIDRWMLGISNVILNYLFITRFGLIGAAFATAIVLVSISIIRVAGIWYTEGLFPYSPKFVKPIAAGIVCGAVLVGLEILSSFSGIVLLVVGAVTGTAAYVFVLVVLGIEPEDREFLADITSRFTE